MSGCLTCGGYGNRHDPIAHGSAEEQPTPHVCQFCDTPLADHWWDPCTYTPPRQGDTVTDRAPITFYRDANRPVEVGTPVYSASGHVVAHVTHVADDGSVTIRAPKPKDAS